MGSRLLGLDALRGVAAICVFVTHLHAYYPSVLQFDTAYLAVDFFFMLSGFVMARSYGKNLGARFLLARYKRLWPISALSVLLCIPFSMPLDARFLIAALFNLALLPAPYFTALFPTNPPLWSIFFELVGNASHTLIRKSGLMSAFCGGVLIFGVWSVGNIDVGVIYGNIWLTLARVGTSYFAGVAIYQKWGDAPPVKIKPVLTFAFIPAFIVATSIYQTWWTDLLFLALCPLIIWGGVQWHPEWGKVAGGLSFPLYALHMPILGYAKWAGCGPITATIAVFAVVLAPSLITRTRQRLQKGQKPGCLACRTNYPP